MYKFSSVTWYVIKNTVLHVWMRHCRKNFPLRISSVNVTKPQFSCSESSSTLRKSVIFVDNTWIDVRSYCFIAQKIKFPINDFFSKCEVISFEEMVTFTEEIFKGNFTFCAVRGLTCWSYSKVTIFKVGSFEYDKKFLEKWVVENFQN